MFISILELFKIGIGPSSSHTMGPMLAANRFRRRVQHEARAIGGTGSLRLRCILKGSLAYTGKGHATDSAVALGLHGFTPESLADQDVDALVGQLFGSGEVELDDATAIAFDPAADIVFDTGETLDAHPNGMVFELVDHDNHVLLSEILFSIGGGFIKTLDEMQSTDETPVDAVSADFPYPFATANEMIDMSARRNISISAMKLANECVRYEQGELYEKIDALWAAMKTCVENGLSHDGVLPGGLEVSRRARRLHDMLTAKPGDANLNDWLCAYAMAVNEENAAGSMVVTAPTNGAAGVIPAVLYHFVHHDQGSPQQIRTFLLVAAAVGGLIKHNSSISGAEVGCQGEVGSASAMAAAGLCAVKGGSTRQIENAAEIALEHHLGMTCDPVKGLVQVPCIERNGFGATNAHTAASLALRGTGEHFMSLDKCISAMKETGLEMSTRYKETALGGLAVSFTEC